MARAMAVRQEPAETVKVWPLEEIIPYERNPRTHPRSQIELLARLMKDHGVDQPIVVDEHGVIIKGHGRLMAAKLAGMISFPVVIKKGLTEAQKRAERIADNQIALLAGWNEELIRLELDELSLGGYDMPTLGFEPVQLKEYLTPLSATDGIDEAERGTLLEMVEITIEEPRHAVDVGHHYILEKRHHLIVESVITGWKVWAPLLIEDAVFCPYPGVFIPFSVRAAKNPLIMVQPDKYICGHILDRFAEVKGEKAVELVR